MTLLSGVVFPPDLAESSFASLDSSSSTFVQQGYDTVVRPVLSASPLTHHATLSSFFFLQREWAAVIRSCNAVLAYEQLAMSLHSNSSPRTVYLVSPLFPLAAQEALLKNIVQ